MAQLRPASPQVLQLTLESLLFQLRGEDLQAALELERSNQQGALHGASLLRAELREAERALSQQREKNNGTARALER